MPRFCLEVAVPLVTEASMPISGESEDRCALATEYHNARNLLLLRCTSMRDNANPHRTGKTFFAAKSEGGIPVEEKICVLDGVLHSCVLTQIMAI